MACILKEIQVFFHFFVAFFFIKLYNNVSVKINWEVKMKETEKKISEARFRPIELVHDFKFIPCVFDQNT